MATLPISPFPVQPARELPDYMPARMVNEFVYCPRLFFYEWVEGLFQESADTVEGKLQHKRVDKGGKPLPAPEQLAEETLETRAVTLSSDRLRVIAKMDLLEVEGGCVTPVDYKHGKPYEVDGALQIWPADRAQLAVQAIVLRENGYRVEEGVIFYAATRQRVRVPLDRGVIEETEAAISDAWALAETGRIPLPLDDSPKCPGCSLNSICLPGETTTLRDAAEEDSGQLALFEEMAVPRKPPLKETRRLIAPRADLRPVYLNTQGLRVGRSGEVLQVKEKDTLRQEIRPIEISQLNLMGNIQVTTQVTQLLCESGIPVCYFSQGGWFYGITTGMATKNVFLRQAQFRLAAEPWFCLKLARRLVAGKIRNQRTMLLRNRGARGRVGERGGTAWDRGKRSASVLRGLRRHAEGGRQGGNAGGFPARLRGAQPATPARPGERAIISGLQHVDEGSDHRVLLSGLRPDDGLLPSAALWEAGAGAGPDGTISPLDRGFGGDQRDQHAHGDGGGFYALGRRGGADTGRAEKLLPCI
jgi:CRISPR-associated protein Cas1